jgi:peptidyl-prolyl cis-trans isomerase SDCCAG10
MRRDIAPTIEPKRKKSALEEMIPSTSVRGRKRPRHGDPGAGIVDASTMKILDAFKAKLDRDRDRDVEMDEPKGKAPDKGRSNGHVAGNTTQAEDDEAVLCDLHFIANCQSCSNWERNGEGLEGDAVGGEDENDTDWMTHALSFAKDRLGKDLTWKRKNEEELVVIDPREKEKEIKLKEREKRRAAISAAGR